MTMLLVMFLTAQGLEHVLATPYATQAECEATAALVASKVNAAAPMGFTYIAECVPVRKVGLKV